ncbi:hypothetical protein [Vallitalea maricola]|uniref:hypothetical protein n=1 Tax=Vallitalea maricola TaxID=3074433 RepID=UPI0030DA8A55
MNKNVKKICIIMIVLISIYFLARPLSFYIILIKNRYNIATFETYKTVNQTSNSKEKIIRIYDYNGNFNYLLLSNDKRKFWTLIKEGQSSSKGNSYSMLLWDEFNIKVEPVNTSSSEEQSVILNETHKIYDVLKDKIDEINLDTISPNLGYEVTENDKFYTIDIYTLLPDSEPILREININTIIDFK